MSLSIIIPAYNEEKRILETLKNYLAFFQEDDTDFIIVLNGCRDNTLSIVNRFAVDYPRKIKIINIAEGIGKGGAVKRGFTLAENEYIGFVDADGATSPDQLKKLFDGIGDAAGAIASRWKPGSEVVNRNFARNFISRCFRLLVKLIFNLPYYDTQCGAKIFKKSFIKKILPILKVDNMAFDVELLYLASLKGYQIKELPSRWVHKDSSVTLGSPLKIMTNSFKIFNTLLTIRFKKKYYANH